MFSIHRKLFLDLKSKSLTHNPYRYLENPQYRSSILLEQEIFSHVEWLIIVPLYFSRAQVLSSDRPTHICQFGLDQFHSLQILFLDFVFWGKKTSFAEPDTCNSSVIRQISKRVFQENIARQIFGKMNILYPLIHTRTCAYQGVRYVRFSENLACFVLLKYTFWDSSGSLPGW